jgi:hypothetical protein
MKALGDIDIIAGFLSTLIIILITESIGNLKSIVKVFEITQTIGICSIVCYLMRIDKK